MTILNWKLFTPIRLLGSFGHRRSNGFHVLAATMYWTIFSNDKVKLIHLIFLFKRFNIQKFIQILIAASLERFNLASIIFIVYLCILLFWMFSFVYHLWIWTFLVDNLISWLAFGRNACLFINACFSRNWMFVC
jgi:hypothetical protein